MTAEYDPRATPWQVSAKEFARLRSPHERIEHFLRYAVLAPSGHNTQPWRFAPFSGGVRIFVDYADRLPTIDPGDRELIMSVGTSIMNLRVAAAHFGYGCDVRYHPASSGRDLVATATFSESGGDHALARLFPAIVSRRTNRNAFRREDLLPSEVDRLLALAMSPAAGLMVVTDHEVKGMLAELVQHGDRIQLSSRAFRRELAALVHPSVVAPGHHAATEGLPVPDVVSWNCGWFAHSLDLGDYQGKQDYHRALDSAALVVIYAEDVQEALLEAGELCQRLLLTLTAEGLQYSFLNQPIQVRRLRPRLRDLLGLGSWPQLLLRLGAGDPLERAMPRRALESVILNSPALDDDAGNPNYISAPVIPPPGPDWWS